MKELIQVAAEGDSITLYTFDATVKLAASSKIEGQSDRSSLLPVVDNISANGTWTNTGEAVKTALRRAQELQAPPDPNRKAAILLFTDGLYDPGPGATRLEDIQITSDQTKPYLFLVWLNDKDKNSEAKLKTFIERWGDKGAFYLSPEAENANLIFRNEVLPQLPARFKIYPTLLDFGTIEPGTTSEKHTLRIESRKPTVIKIKLIGVGNDEIGLGVKDELFLEPGANSVQLNLMVGSSVPEGPRTAVLQISLGENAADTVKTKLDSTTTMETMTGSTWESVAVRVNVTHASLTYIILRLIAALLLITIISAVVFCFYKRESPFSLYRRWRL